MLRRRILLSLAVVVATVLAARILANKLQNPDGEGKHLTLSPCRYEEAVGFPSWITTGVWRDGNLLLVDAINGRLLKVSNRGVADEFQSAAAEYLKDLGVTRIRAGTRQITNAQLIAELRSGKLLALDQNLSPGNSFDLQASRLYDHGNRVVMLVDWIAAGDEIVAYADLEASSESPRWNNGFVRFKFEKPVSYRLLRERPFPDKTRVAMLLTYPFLASNGSDAYTLLLDPEVGIWHFGPKDTQMQPLKSIPQLLRGKPGPNLPFFQKPEDFPRLMEAAERETMPAGLLSWKDSLFVVSRSLIANERRWYLSKIEPKIDSLLWTVRIPGNPNHLTIIPGPTEWAFLEKGPVTHYLTQYAHHIRFVRSTQFDLPNLKFLCQ